MKNKKSAIKIIIDTNIIFSGILNSAGKIGKILTGSKFHFEFYTCDFLRVELLKHRGKLVKRTKLSTTEVEELEFLVTSNIVFINERLIPEKIINYAESLLEEIDPNDVPFVALAKHLKAKLWTGDKELYTGLRKKGFKDVITTLELSLLLDKLEQD